MPTWTCRRFMTFFCKGDRAAFDALSERLTLVIEPGTAAKLETSFRVEQLDRVKPWRRRCQPNANRSPKPQTTRRSGSQLTPLGQGGRAVLLEHVAGVKVAVLVEVIVD